jgi:DNA repair exonuclease SbcCD ATPase subunit
MENLPIEITETQATNLPTLPSMFSAENLEALFKQVEDEVKDEVPDVETEEGRARIKSIALKIAKSKTAIDTPIRDHLRAMKAIPKVLEANARESIERFDSLKAKVLAPLEAAQAKQDELINWMVGVPAWCNSCEQSSLVEGVVADLAAVDLSQFWPELAKKAKQHHEASTIIANDTLKRLRNQEEQAAEIERLRKKDAERERAEHERKIAEAAAEKAREDERQRAQLEREQAERRAVEAKQREEQQRLAAEQAKRDAEAAEQRRIEAEKLAEQQRIEAAEKAKRDAAEAAELAAKQERERIEAEEAESKRLADARAADKEHRIKVNRAAMVALMSEGFSEEDAKKIVTAVAKGLIPNIIITY